MMVIFVAEVFLQNQEITYLENILKYFACLKVCKSFNRLPKMQ